MLPSELVKTVEFKHCQERIKKYSNSIKDELKYIEAAVSDSPFQPYVDSNGLIDFYLRGTISNEN